MTQPGAVALIAFALLGAACARPEGQSHADAVARAACQRHADEVLRMRNPEAIYNADSYATSRLDSPFSGPGPGAVVTKGLSSEYERDRIVDDCVRNGAAAPDPAGSTTQ